MFLAAKRVTLANYFQVEADGRHYDEMHVDGGVVGGILNNPKDPYTISLFESVKALS